jgi:apolipoprotein N-acyltransferase
MKAFWGSLFPEILISIIAAVASGFLLSAGFPVKDYSLLPWIGLVPLLFVLCNRGPISGFLLAFISGAVFFLNIFEWILEVPGYLYLHHAILAVYLGSFFGLFGLAVSFISRRRGKITALFVAPCLWVCFEYIRSNLSFMALPWGLLAHSQYTHPIVIQISAITGAYGVSFLVVMVNAAITALILIFFQRIGAAISSREKVSLSQAYALMATAGSFLAFCLVYGYATVGKGETGGAIKIATIQPNIEQDKKWDPKHEKFIMQTLRDLTLEASAQKPALIVWPETATPRSITENYGLYLQVQETATKAGAPILLGSSERRKYEKKSPNERKYLNSAFLIQPQGVKTKVQKYDKIRLMPFGEYLPNKETIPWARLRVPNIGGYVPWKEFTTFELGNLRFCTLICWESIFPGLVRPFLQRGADLIINITNEAWFGKSAAAYQFLSMNVFRAVEHRVAMVRCANTGISCFIDPYGRVTGRVHEDGEAIFVKGFLTGEVPIYRERTIYTSLGDAIIYVSAVISFLILILCFAKVNRK